jgi:hypothetical protein
MRVVALLAFWPASYPRPYASGETDLMGIKITRDEDQNLTIHDVTGIVSEEEMYDALENFYIKEPTKRLLWDMSQTDVSHVTPDILEEFIRGSVNFGSLHNGGRVAVFASQDLQYGLARMSKAFAEMESALYSFNVFRSRKEALDWLISEDPS